MACAHVRGPGAPDAVCDFVAASVVEEYLRRDSASSLHVRVVGGRGVLFVAGELSSSADFDVSAVVKRAVAQAGVQTTIEPFIAFETLAPLWAQACAGHEAISVMGYASRETPSLEPRVRAYAKEAARLLERERTSNPEWFWLGSDYDVWAHEQGQSILFVVRAEHVDEKNVAFVRDAIATLIHTRFSEAEVRVNVAGEETQAGLGNRMGSSGRMGNAEVSTSSLPTSASGAGLHLSHPLNLGSWLLRQEARRLVQMGQGQAIMIHASWFPLESRPSLLRARNEQGKDVVGAIDQARLDLRAAPPAFLQPGLGVAALRAPVDGSISLPWEE